MAIATTKDAVIAAGARGGTRMSTGGAVRFPPVTVASSASSCQIA